MVGEEYVRSGTNILANDYFIICDEDGTNRRAEYGSYYTIAQTDVGRVLALCFRRTNQVQTVTYSDVQVEKGSVGTTYEPFTNTLYGGYVDYEKGEVVATWGYEDIKANASRYTWGSTNTSGNYFAYRNMENIGAIKPDSTQMFTSGIIQNPYYYNLYGANCACFVYQYLRVGGFGCETFQEWQEYLQNQSTCGFCYELATPIHYSLTSTLIKSLKGANTIWSDMNGDLQISYWKH